MKSLYDALIDGIPEDLQIDDVMCTHYGAIVKYQGNIGISEFREETDTRPMIETGNKLEMSLKELAQGIKSWNITEATIGHAAINAYYNSPEMVKKNGIYLTDSLYSEDRTTDPFISHQKEMAGKKVVIVGHFPFIDQLLKPICDLYIIEQRPYLGDYPEQAAEYLLPDADYAFFGALTISDKRLPRLLELAKNAYVGIVGPVTTLSPILFDYGVDELNGFVVKDQALAERITKEQQVKKIYASGQKVNLKKL
ncbi:MAG: hypothetical protein IKV96_04050 [Firmicutes bacterium]|nr:hypothetical protein [Bacillota bacterium]